MGSSSNFGPKIEVEGAILEKDGQIFEKFVFRNAIIAIFGLPNIISRTSRTPAELEEKKLNIMGANRISWQSTVESIYDIMQLKEK